MKKKSKTARAKPAKRGYTAADMKAVSDNPEWTEKMLARARPFAELFPGFAESIKRSRGRPRVENPKEAVTLRLSADTVRKFKAAGDDWRAKMAKALERVKV